MGVQGGAAPPRQCRATQNPAAASPAAWASGCAASSPTFQQRPFTMDSCAVLQHATLILQTGLDRRCWISTYGWSKCGSEARFRAQGHEVREQAVSASAPIRCAPAPGRCRAPPCLTADGPQAALPGCVWEPIKPQRGNGHCEKMLNCSCNQSNANHTEMPFFCLLTWQR